MAETRKLTVESTYCQNWTIIDALRELIQNAVDTDTKVSFTRKGIFYEIKDNGCGVKLSDFLIGRSSKQSDDKAIGQFGEGAPVGCLVLSRNHRQVIIRSLDKQYSFSLQYDNQWGSDLLTIEIEPCSTSTGTSVLVECSDDELDTAKSLFTKFNPPPVLAKVKGIADIISAIGIVYVNGLAVTKINSVLGYNFFDKSLVNRDRAAIGYDAICTQISRTISELTNKEIIITLLKEAVHNDSSKIEFSVNFLPKPTQWRTCIKLLFGNRVCLSSTPTSDLAALENNWYVLKVPFSFSNSLSCMLQTSFMVTRKEKKMIPVKALSEEAKSLLYKGKEIADEMAREAGLDTFPIKVFQDTLPKEARFYDWRGYYCNGTVGISIDLLNAGGLSEIVKTLLHEYVHGTNGNSDNTRAFENDLCDVMASLALALVAERSKNHYKLNYTLI
jgi:hypothetical protein